MKVAFIGTHGVGKTTLCFELAARLKRHDVNVELVLEVARRCPLPINLETSSAAQSWILHTQMALELENGPRGDLLLCDRSVLDNYCYLVFAAGPQPAWEPLLEAWLPTYDLLVKVPLWTPPRWDGVREVNVPFQRAIDSLIDEQIERRDLRVLRLAESDRDRWGDVVMARLEPLLFPSTPLFPDEGQ